MVCFSQLLLKAFHFQAENHNIWWNFPSVHPACTWNSASLLLLGAADGKIPSGNLNPGKADRKAPSPISPHHTWWVRASVTGPSYSFGRDAQMAPKASGIRDKGFYSHFLHDVDVEPTNNFCLQCRQTAPEPTSVLGTGGREGSDGHSPILLLHGTV